MRTYAGIVAVGLGLLVAPCAAVPSAHPSQAPAAGAALDVRKTVAFCNQFNLVAASDRGLGQYSNTQIENGVCMLSKIDVQLIGQSAPQRAQDVCMAATESVFLEFKRRFPNRNAKETIGRC